MKNSSTTSKNNLLDCIQVFLFFEICLLILANIWENPFSYFITLFVAGWLLWTFAEYVIHRFLMHELIVPGKKDELFHHHQHHQNPGDLRVTWLHRLVIGILGSLILGVALYLNSNFTFFAGFIIGFIFYNFLHYLLHRPIGGYIFPKIQRAHILHHTRFPHCGYSFSTILWDWLFDTLPPKDAEVTEQMKKNYFNHLNKRPKTYPDVKGIMG